MLVTGSTFAEPTLISTQYLEDRFYIMTPPVNGVSATLLLDSGGSTGLYSEFSWYWKTKESKVENNYLFFEKEVPFKNFPMDAIQGNSIRLISANDEEGMFARKFLRDGLLGNGWLGKMIWRFNYPQKSLSSLTSIGVPKGSKIPIHFKEGLYYPRMGITVDGQNLDVLFDTGATSFFSSNAMSELGLKEAFSASSFMRESVFDSWTKKHPEWKVIKAGDRMGNYDLIRVPLVELAGYKVGPIWFAKRPNKAYDEYMSQYMDCKCAGAIGGNVLKNFEVIVDYPAKSAWFYKN